MKIGIGNWARPFASAWRVVVFTLVVCATGQVWAVTANVVWESDFGTTVKTGLDGKTYTLILPDNVSVVDGCLSIGSGNQGASIAISPNNIRGWTLSVLMEYEGATAKDTAVPIYLEAEAYFGLKTKGTSLGILGDYWGATYPTGADPATTTTMPASGYFLFVFPQGGVQAYSASTLSGLTDASAGGTISGLSFSNKPLEKIGIGGTPSSKNSLNAFDGLKIKKVAIFTSTISTSDAAAYTFPSESSDYCRATVTDANTDWSTVFPSWDDSADNSGKIIELEIQDGASLTKTSALSVRNLVVAGSGSLTLSGALTATSGLGIGSGATVTLSGGTSSPISNNGTLNVNGCTVSGVITNCGMLNTDGTVSLSGANVFKNGSTLDVKTGTTELTASVKEIDGTIYIRKNAILKNMTGDARTWNAPTDTYVYGTLHMNGTKWTTGGGCRIHLYDEALIDGPAGQLHFNSGEASIIAEAGSSTIKAKVLSGQGTGYLNVKQDVTLTIERSITSGQYDNSSNVGGTKTGPGTLVIKGRTNIAGSEGKVIVKAESANINHVATGIAYSGELKVEAAEDYYHQFLWVASPTAGTFANRPMLDTEGEMSLYDAIGSYPLEIKNLSGTGIFRMRGSNNNKYRYVDTLQTTDTMFAGTFSAITGYAASDSALIVRGADGAASVKSLTLSGASNTTGPLTVTNNAKVVFSSTGKWSGGSVIVAKDGVLESQNSASIADTLTVQKGATLAFADGDPALSATVYDWSDVSGELADAEKVKVDLYNLTPSNDPITLISSGVTISADKFTPLYATTGYSASLSVVDGALKVTFSGNYNVDGDWKVGPNADQAATIVLTQNATLSTPTDVTLGTVTLINHAGGTVTLGTGGAGKYTFGGLTVPRQTTLNVATSLDITGTVSGSGTINVLDDGELTMEDTTCSSVINVQTGGTLKTKGTTTLSAANTSATGSLIEIVDGETTLSSAFAGICGDITVESVATMILDKSLSGDTDYLIDHVSPTNPHNIVVRGTIDFGENHAWELGATNIELYEGATITGSAGDYYGGSLTWTGIGTVKVYGNAEIDCAIRTVTYLSPTFEISENATLSITKAPIAQNVTVTYYGINNTSGGAITKAGLGTLDLTAITPTKPITINAGTVVADEVPSANVTINANGTFTLKDCAWASGDVFSGDGTLELYSRTISKTHTITGSSFNGILKLSNVEITPATNPPTYQNNINPNGAAMFSGSPELVLNSTLTHLGNAYYKNNSDHPLAVRNLSGNGVIRSEWSSGDFSYVVKTTQTKDTEFSGTLSSSVSSGNRVVNLMVLGDGSGIVHGLTISNEQNATDDAAKRASTLTVSDNAKVVFPTGAGWGYGQVVVDEGGYLECTNNAAVRHLTLHDGATLVFPTSTSLLSGISSITFASGTVTNSFPGGVPATGGMLINWTSASLGSAPAGSFVFDNGLTYKEFNGAYYFLQADTTGLYILKAVAVDSLASPSPTFYTTITAALAENDTVYLVGAPNETVRLSSGKTINNSKGKDVSNLTVNAPTAEYVSPIPAVNGSYSLSNAASQPATYYWTGAVDAEWWGTLGNWSVGATDGPTATRAMESTDFVSFGDGADVHFASSKTVSGIAVSGVVTLRGGASLTVAGNITGTGTMSLNDVCLASSASGITVAPAIIFANDSELAGANPLTLNGEVTITGVFKIWDSVHIISGAVTISSGATVQTGTTNGNGGALTITGPTRINGSFNKSGDNVLTLGAVTVASSAVPTITNAGSISLTGAVTVANGATFTLPASGLNVGNSASFVLSGRSSVLVDNGSGASGKVSTSLTDGAKVISSTTAGVTTYKVVYGTIFSVW